MLSFLNNLNKYVYILYCYIYNVMNFRGKDFFVYILVVCFVDTWLIVSDKIGWIILEIYIIV